MPSLIAEAIQSLKPSEAEHLLGVLLEQMLRDEISTDSEREKREARSAWSAWWEFCEEFPRAAGLSSYRSLLEEEDRR